MIPETTPPTVSQLERRGGLATIHKPEGTYSFLYGAHVLAEDPSRLPPDIDGCILETGEMRWERQPIPAIAYFRSAPINRQFRHIIPEAERRGIPLYFVDPVWAHSRRRILADFGILGIEAFIGKELIGSNRAREPRSDVPERMQCTMREILAAWCTLPSVAFIGRTISALTGIGNHVTAEALKLSHRLHPEQGAFLTTLRNIVIAEKLEWLMRQTESGRHLCTVMGAAHVDIERFVQDFTSQERMRRLSLLRPLVSGVIHTTFTDIVECQFDGKEWQESARFTVPTLQGVPRLVSGDSDGGP